MPPKKMTATRPMRKQALAAASSSSDEDPNKFFNFIDEDTYKAHHDRFANREVLTGRRVLFSELESIEPFFSAQNLVPFLASIGDK